MTKEQTLLSGIQPSGNLHIGNYLGAIKQWVALQKEYETYILVVDLHAITVPQKPEKLRGDTLAIAKFLIACGIDPQKTTLFVQSHVRAHSELGWILTTLTPLGELEKMTQFKEKGERIGVLAGLLNYPILQSADILLYHPDIVPVGEDQLQHLELTRTLARRFNNRFGKTFKEPKALVRKETGRIMALDDPHKKMSKSASSPNNYIAILDSPSEIQKKIKIAVTDSGKEVILDEKKKPAISNLMGIYSAFSGTPVEKIEQQYTGKNYAKFKQHLADIVIEALKPIQEKYRKLSKDENAVLAALQEGAKKATIVAEKTLRDVKEKMGFMLS